jgi:precorrin-8X/cobalt-precorrin-8 methylmutase
LAKEVEDRPDNSNNRFGLASRLNTLFGKAGPFWGHPHGQSHPALFPKRAMHAESYPPLRRHTESLIKTAKTAWQLFGNGSVGGQALLGIAFLQRLITHPTLRKRVSVWPFENGDADRPIVLAEIYPSLLKIEKQPGVPHDRTQVTTLARYFADWDAAGTFGEAFALPEISDPAMRKAIVAEEGCILGVGCMRPPLKACGPPTALNYIRDPAEITRRSFAIIAKETKLTLLPTDIRPAAARIVHACGMPDVISDLAFSSGAGSVGKAALQRGAPIVCDVRMVAAGLAIKRLANGNSVHVALDEKGAQKLAERSGQTRSAAGMEIAAKRWKDAIVVIGNAPTALFRLLELVAAGAAKPALVLGFPVGFVGAPESKAALAESGLPFITLHGRRGGSAIAAAALNALILGDAE